MKIENSLKIFHNFNDKKSSLQVIQREDKFKKILNVPFLMLIIDEIN